MICAVARRGGISGRIGDFVAQKTIADAANCASPGNPRQQVRRWVRTPRPNTLAQQWTAKMLRIGWQWHNFRFNVRFPEVLAAAEREGFWFYSGRILPDGVTQDGYYKAALRGTFIQSIVREMTRQASFVNKLPIDDSTVRTQRLFFDSEIDLYLNTLPTIPYGYSPR